MVKNALTLHRRLRVERENGQNCPNTPPEVEGYRGQGLRGRREGTKKERAREERRG